MLNKYVLGNRFLELGNSRYLSNNIRSSDTVRKSYIKFNTIEDNYIPLVTMEGNMFKKDFVLKAAEEGLKNKSKIIDAFAWSSLALIKFDTKSGIYLVGRGIITTERLDPLIVVTVDTSIINKDIYNVKKGLKLFVHNSYYNPEYKSLWKPLEIFTKGLLTEIVKENIPIGIIPDINIFTKPITSITAYREQIPHGLTKNYIFSFNR